MNIFNLKNNYLYKNIFKQTEFLVYCLLSFFVPFLIGHPQILIGSLVNFFLIRTAQYFDAKYVLAIVFLPSLGVYSTGILFSNLTTHLLYFIPFIWISNLLFIYIYKQEVIFKKNNPYLSSIKTSFAKAGLLFLVAVIFVFAFNFSQIFLLTMGVIQLITAIIGSFLSSAIYVLENKNVKKI